MRRPRGSSGPGMKIEDFPPRAKADGKNAARGEKAGGNRMGARAATLSVMMDAYHVLAGDVGSGDDVLLLGIAWAAALRSDGMEYKGGG